MKATATLSDLTTLEKQIAELTAWGYSKKEIALILEITVRSVEGHTRKIFSKTGVSKSNELSAFWFCRRYDIPITDSPLCKLNQIKVYHES